MSDDAQRKKVDGPYAVTLDFDMAVFTFMSAIILLRKYLGRDDDTL